MSFTQSLSVCVCVCVAVMPAEVKKVECVFGIVQWVWIPLPTEEVAEELSSIFNF